MWVRFISFCLCVGVPVVTAGQISAQGATGLSADEVRALLVDGIEKSRAQDIAMARAIPDSALRWAPVPGVRTFGEQIVHAANNLWVQQLLYGSSAPDAGDPQVYLADKAALVEAVTRWNDWLVESLRAMPDGDLFEMRTVDGRPMERWRMYLFILQHAIWTRGQLVPYFRAHGMAPPPFQAF